MHSRRFIARLPLVLAVASGSLFAYSYVEENVDPGRVLREVTSLEDALGKASQSDRLVLVEFSAAWCEPCRRMAQVTYRDPRVLKRIEEGFVFVKVDIDDVVSREDHLSGRDLAEEYSVRSVPTHIILDPEACELRRIRGYLKADAFLKELSGLHNPNRSKN
jgi:thiol:disulfide interchange protein DsbD